MKELKKTVSKYFFGLIAVCYVTEGIVDVAVASVWPVIANAIKAHLSLIGILVMVYYLGAIIMSPNTYKIRHCIGTNYTMVLSQICFSTALFLYIIASNIYIFALGMFVNGMGCGLLEINASSYVLKAYDAKEESILYGFWGLGSVLGSTVMVLAINYYPPYKRGFAALIIIILVNIILLLLAKRNWEKQKETLPDYIINIHSVTEEEKKTNIKIKDLLKDKKVIFVLCCFFLSQSVIITFNSLVSTIAVSHRDIYENTAVIVPIIYYTAIFVGRVLFGIISKRTKVITVLKTNIMVLILLFTILCIKSLNGFAVCAIMILIGFVASPIIPFMNAYIKEMFDVKYLSALLGYGDVSGVFGIIVISGLTTFVMKMTSIQVVEFTFIVLSIVLYFLLIRIEKENI